MIVRHRLGAVIIPQFLGNCKHLHNGTYIVFSDSLKSLMSIIDLI
jgi:hypothetical protein